MRAARRTPTSKLANGRLVFTSDRRFMRAVSFAAVAALVVLVLVIGRRLHLDGAASGTTLAGLQQQNATLKAELSRARIELELERATRAALARQVADVNAEASELKRRLDFFNSQSGRAATTR